MQKIGKINCNITANDLIIGGIVVGGAITLFNHISKKARANAKKAREELEAYRTEQLSSIDIKAIHDSMNAASNTKESADNALVLNIELMRLKGLAEVSDSKANIKKYVDEIKEISEAYTNNDTLTIATLAIRYKEKKEKRALESEREHQLSLIREKAKIEADADIKITNNIVDAVNGLGRLLNKPSFVNYYGHVKKSEENS